ncbi:hypothetical protein EYZ11_001418 [Aspergillus tanneri]|uniref:Roadblock/LAMTOR2 domain-containing protein n=1 Tax=Aspergillus tanneri TaxID=1220188 RepID=A0A4S3JUN6_9EURO|nr:hypothetical protein EYZ11_001418 [Aspergillus tanneri]
MATTTTTTTTTTQNSQIPQHVTALLSHLTARPGVQSTFILSRKDGSIIQSTGLLASKPATSIAQISATTEEPPSSTTPTSPTVSTSPSTSASTTPGPTPLTPYQPSQAEALAARIFAFVSSATDLSLTLSRPPGTENKHTSPRLAESNGMQGLGIGATREEGEAEGSEREDDDECTVQLIRLAHKGVRAFAHGDSNGMACF